MCVRWYSEFYLVQTAWWHVTSNQTVQPGQWYGMNSGSNTSLFYILPCLLMPHSVVNQCGNLAQLESSCLYQPTLKLIGCVIGRLCCQANGCTHCWSCGYTTRLTRSAPSQVKLQWGAILHSHVISDMLSAGTVNTNKV